MFKRDYLTLDDFEYRDKTVLLRVDINSPIDPRTKKIVNENRIDKSLPTIKKLTDLAAKLVIIAHQGDTLDYHNLISLKEHTRILSQKLGKLVQFIDDVAGPTARERIKNLKQGEILLLDNLRYLTEEVSTFENNVKLSPEEMTHTYLVRNIAPLVDYYVNDAFAAAHRNSPSMVAFQELLPSAVGVLYDREVSTLTKVLKEPKRPCVFLLGGAKISDAFGMMKKVLVEPAKEYLKNYPGKLLYPLDFGVYDEGKRGEVTADELPVEKQIIDIGPKTTGKYEKIIEKAGTIFVNGPAGIYEEKMGAYATKELWRIIGEAKDYSVIGGGDTVTSVTRLGDLRKISYVCTGGGALIRFLSGTKLPLVEAMKKARERWASIAKKS